MKGNRLFAWFSRILHRKKKKDVPQGITSSPAITISPAELRRRAEKHIKQSRIREANLARKRATMGHGLNSKHFKPRPAFEKRTWKLDEKPEDDA